MAEILHASASVSFRGRQWTSAAFADGRSKMEDGKLCGKTDKNGINGRNQGGVGDIDSVSLSQLPRTPGDVRGMCGRKMEDGSWEIMRKTQKNLPKWKKIGRGGRNISSASFRGRP